MPLAEGVVDRGSLRCMRGRIASTEDCGQCSRSGVLRDMAVSTSKIACRGRRGGRRMAVNAKGGELALARSERRLLARFSPLPVPSACLLRSKRG